MNTYLTKLLERKQQLINELEELIKNSNLTIASYRGAITELDNLISEFEKLADGEIIE